MEDKYISEPITNQPATYQIRIKGHLGQQRMDWFEGLSIVSEEDGNTLLSGPAIDQSALHGLLKKIRDLGVPLLSVNRVDSNQITKVEVDQIEGVQDD